MLVCSPLPRATPPPVQRMVSMRSSRIVAANRPNLHLDGTSSPSVRDTAGRPVTRSSICTLRPHRSTPRLRAGGSCLYLPRSWIAHLISRSLACSHITSFSSLPRFSHAISILNRSCRLIGHPTCWTAREQRLKFVHWHVMWVSTERPHPLESRPTLSISVAGASALQRIGCGSPSHRWLHQYRVWDAMVTWHDEGTRYTADLVSLLCAHHSLKDVVVDGTLFIST